MILKLISNYEILYTNLKKTNELLIVDDSLISRSQNLENAKSRFTLRNFLKTRCGPKSVFAGNKKTRTRNVGFAK